MNENRFKLHIKWFNPAKTNGEATLTDNGQPILCTERIEDARLLKNLLNELYDENEQLKHNNKMLSMKMSEVSTKYRLLKEFSEDTNPNEAVKTVLHELMMITKEYR